MDNINNLPQPKSNILIVDDTLANLRLLAELLSQNGYEVRLAPSGELALRTVASRLPDLILLDIMMPGMDGYEVCRQLKASEASRHVPVIFLSALGETMDKVKAFNIGGIDYITKPFEPGEVLARIKTHLAIRMMQQQLEAQNAILQREIAEHQRLVEELISSEKMASLGRLVAGFSHEINTPIGIAIGSASALPENIKDINKLITKEEVSEEELTAILKQIEAAVALTLSNLRRAADLVSSFKRTAIDQSQEQMQHFAVKMTIEDVINTLRNQFKRTAIQIQIDCASNLTIYSYPGVLEQILTNLMMNSLIHGFENGKQAGHIRITVNLKENQLHLKYADSGKGIESALLEKVFEPFFTTDRAHGGSGLGLYICYNLITMRLQGTITCESTPGKGVTFKMAYPVQL